MGFVRPLLTQNDPALSFGRPLFDTCYFKMYTYINDRFTRQARDKHRDKHSQKHPFVFFPGLPQSYARLFRVPGSTQNKKIFLLDDLLSRVLYGGGNGGGGSAPAPPTEVHQKSALTLLLKRMKLSHKIDVRKKRLLEPILH
eukprot:COSAG06_NODE_1815_length_8303_cov_3.031936_11_plen_142_part_00